MTGNSCDTCKSNCVIRSPPTGRPKSKKGSAVCTALLSTHSAMYRAWICSHGQLVSTPCTRQYASNSEAVTRRGSPSCLSV